MANIYSEQGITQTPVAEIGQMSTGSEARQAAKMFDVVEQNLQKKAEEHQKLATELYENGSNIAIHQGLNEIMRNPKFATNPEAFAQEADKMAAKIFGEIQNPEMKQRVMMNYELKKNPYVNHVYDNMYKLQNQQQEDQIVMGIQNNLDNLSTSLGNVMNGVMGVDDLRNLSESKKEFDRYINAKNSQGFDVFTARERLALEKKYNENVLNALKDGFDSLPEERREEIAKNIDDGFNTISKVKYKGEGEEYSFGALNVLPKNMVGDIKKYIKDGVQKDRQAKIREFNLMRQESRVNFIKDPTETNLNAFLSMNPDASEATITRLKALIKGYSPNELAETSADALEEATSMIADFSSKDFTGKDGKLDANAQFEDSLKVLEYIEKQNSGEGKLKDDDRNKLVQQVADILKEGEESLFAREFAPEVKGFNNFLSSLRYFGNSDTSYFEASLTEKERKPFNKWVAKGVVRDTINGAINAYQSGDVELAKKIYREGKKKLMILRNPEFEGKEVGDSVIVNGKAYTFLGYGDNDIIVKGE